MSKGLTIIDKDYTQCALSAKSNQSRRKSKPRIAQVLLGTWSRHRRNAR